MGKTLSVAEVAERLDVHETTIHVWIRQGHFPGTFKKGPGKTSPYAIPVEAVTAFIDARRQTQVETTSNG